MQITTQEIANLYRSEFIFERVVYDFRWSLGVMQYFRDELKLREDDVPVAIFAKSGEFSWVNVPWDPFGQFVQYTISISSLCKLV